MGMYFSNYRKQKAAKEIWAASYLGHEMAGREENVILLSQNERILELAYKFIQLIKEEKMSEILLETNSAIKNISSEDDQRIMDLLENYGDPIMLINEYSERTQMRNNQSYQSILTLKQCKSKFG